MNCLLITIGLVHMLFVNPSFNLHCYIGVTSWKIERPYSCNYISRWIIFGLIQDWNLLGGGSHTVWLKVDNSPVANGNYFYNDTTITLHLAVVEVVSRHSTCLLHCSVSSILFLWSKHSVIRPYTNLVHWERYINIHNYNTSCLSMIIAHWAVCIAILSSSV